MAIDFGPAQRRAARAYARNSARRITGSVMAETLKAYRIKTATREGWIPKALVTREEGGFVVPSWLCERKLLD